MNLVSKTKKAAKIRFFSREITDRCKEMRVCTEKWVPIIISTIALLISCISYSNVRKLNYQHIKPGISCKLNYPLKDNPTIIIKNESPIKIVSLGIKHRLFTFDKRTNEVGIGVLAGDALGGENMIFQEELGPSAFTYQQLIKISENGHHPTGKIIIYLFNMRYYRPTDMKQYDDREIYFVDEGTVYTHKEFMDNPYYKDIISQIQACSFPADKYIYNDNLSRILPGKQK